MAQLTIRAPEELIARVRSSASDAGRSMNDYVTSILDAATDPDLADSASEQLRERLRRAGLLITTTPLPGRRPSKQDVEVAGAAAAEGRLLSDLVADGR